MTVAGGIEVERGRDANAAVVAGGEEPIFRLFNTAGRAKQVFLPDDKRQDLRPNLRRCE